MLTFLKDHIRAAGKICVAEQKKLSATDIHFKSAKDIVTRVDLEVETYLRNQIMAQFPDHGIIGEEEGERVGNSEYCWIIDPIDGTTSYLHTQSYYSISVALRKGPDLILAAVYAPALDQLYHAERGKGSYLGNEKLSVSTCDNLGSAVLATGFACLRSNWEHNNLIYFNKLLPLIRDVRRCGSAALDLAYVAAGKYDGFWELNLNLYDIAAGVLLVEEAGGFVCDFKGHSNYPEKGIVATNGRYTESLLAHLGWPE